MGVLPQEAALEAAGRQAFAGGLRRRWSGKRRRHHHRCGRHVNLASRSRCHVRHLEPVAGCPRWNRAGIWPGQGRWWCQTRCFWRTLGAPVLPFTGTGANPRPERPWLQESSFVPDPDDSPPVDEASGDITNLLRAWSGGDQAALDRLAEHVYPELRRIARRYMKSERQANTLQSTALVHEVYLRLVDVRNVDWRQRAQFYAM